MVGQFELSHVLQIFVSCSAVNCNVWGDLGWVRVFAYGWSIRFLLVHHMLPKCLVFAFRTPFIRRNTWPLTISTVRFPSFLIRASFVWVTLTLVIAKDEIYKFIVLCSIPPIRNKIGDESPTVKVSITSAVRITSTTISCSNFGVVIHKLLWWSLQTFVAIFRNFSSDSYKLLPHCLQTFAMTFINFCRVVHKLLLLFC